MKRKITSKGNGRNFYAWEGGEVREVIKTGGRFYFGKIIDFELFPVGEPLKKNEFYF